MEPITAALGTAASTAKEMLSLKLETPFILFGSLVGELSCWVLLPGDYVFTTPLGGLSKFVAWTGWTSASSWIDIARQWITSPERADATYFLFSLMVVLGVAFAAYGTRAAFSALVGIGGLIEVGATTSAWLIPLAALLFVAIFTRLLPPDGFSGWLYAEQVCLMLIAALIYFVLALFALVIGEPKPEPRQSIDLEIPSRTKRFIDERLEAFGMQLHRPRRLPTIEVDHDRLAQALRNAQADQSLTRPRLGPGVHSRRLDGK
ncbi:Uncharacterised protein [Mycobacteroides abscessus subsp. massiliense]|uniref:hypothetical protein n=1 Tax=Mycobacteroides abscessus TaxID=36809 RepID=UPI0009A88F21|nr:hypothetical protein [Mycobacteroides abscessus]SKI78879.1 Uncharacterised protein [Mycobacteroides abscessus subsp. massiliense]